MTEQNTQVPRRALRLPRLDLWTLAACAIAVVVLAPMASVLWIAFHPTENIWPHLVATVLPRYLGNTLVLMLGVAVLTAMVGTGAAWLTTMY
ncbi:MAG: iron ABC transporter permease, partial [Gemmobacter sp.]